MMAYLQQNKPFIGIHRVHSAEDKKIGGGYLRAGCIISYFYYIYLIYVCKRL